MSYIIKESAIDLNMDYHIVKEKILVFPIEDTKYLPNTSQAYMNSK